MSIREQLAHDLKTALKGGDRLRGEVLRFVSAQLQNRAIEKRGKGDSADLTDAEVLEVLKRDVKKRKESIALFEKGGRADLVTKETAELAFVTPYLPPAPSTEDIVKVVAELRAAGITEFPVLMKAALARLKGADGGEVAKVIKG